MNKFRLTATPWEKTICWNGEDYALMERLLREYGDQNAISLLRSSATAGVEVFSLCLERPASYPKPTPPGRCQRTSPGWTFYVTIMKRIEPYTGFEQGPIRPPSEAGSLLIRITLAAEQRHCEVFGVYSKVSKVFLAMSPPIPGQNVQPQQVRKE